MPSVSHKFPFLKKRAQRDGAKLQHHQALNTSINDQTPASTLGNVNAAGRDSLKESTFQDLADPHGADVEGTRTQGMAVDKDHQKVGLISQLVAARDVDYISEDTQCLADGQNAEEADTTKWGLKVIKKQPPGRVDAVDIIAVHGLGGHWEGTWTAAKTEVNWLRSLLHDDIPNARIFSYSYNSKEYFSKSISNIQDFALDLLVDYKSYRTSVAEKSRPVIFLCHSLGGIVFKQMLICANEDPEYLNVLGHVHGVIFFATPHAGSSLASWNSIATNIVRAASLYTSTNTISKDLKLRSDLLTSIAGSWTHRGKNLEIVSCWETISMYGTIVVEKDSALLNWPNETAVPMTANHSTICTFSGRGEPDYRKIITRLRDMVENGTQKFRPEGRKPLSTAERNCLTKLETSDYESHFTQIVLPVRGTCRWIFGTERYRDWSEARGARLLWISADAGCGKSVLAKYLIQYNRVTRPNTKVCFFIFQDGNQEQEDSVHALSAILHQILSSQPELMEHAILKQNHFVRGPNLTKAFNALWEVFRDCIHDKRFKDTLCIIDALDECEELTRALLVEQLALLFATSRPKRFPLKIIITSRPDNTIKTAFQTIPNIRLRAEDEITGLNNDIQLYVQTSINEIATQSELPSDLLTDLQEALIKGADFTFLWTSLVIQLLKEKSLGGMSRADLEGILRTRNLDDIYEQLLHGRPNPLKTKKMLQIVVAAARPLTLEELSIAMELHQDYKRAKRIALPPGDKLDRLKKAYTWRMNNADPSKAYRTIKTLDDLEGCLKYPFSNHVRLLCGHFLRIRGRKVYLVHQTARRFLLMQSSKHDISVGHCLREFQWNISCPTAKDLRHMEHHGIPGFSEVEPKIMSKQIWRQSIREDVSNRYLLQVCIDYLTILDNGEIIRRESDARFGCRVAESYIDTEDALRNISKTDAGKWYHPWEWCRNIQEKASGKFIDYATRYWVSHYQSVREDVGGYFDYLCKPGNLLFTIWIKDHPSFWKEHQDMSRKKRAVDSFLKDQTLDIDGPKAILTQEAASFSEQGNRRYCFFDDEDNVVYGRCSLQDVLDHFNLDRGSNDLWDEENIEGSHYWNEHRNSISSSEGSEKEPEVVAGVNFDTKKLPDRILAYRKEHKNSIVESENVLSSNPSRVISSFPTAGGTLCFSSVTSKDFGQNEQASAASVQKGFKTSWKHRLSEGNPSATAPTKSSTLI